MKSFRIFMTKRVVNNDTCIDQDFDLKNFLSTPLTSDNIAPDLLKKIEKTL